jgi:hypothetical protein
MESTVFRSMCKKLCTLLLCGVKLWISFHFILERYFEYGEKWLGLYVLGITNRMCGGYAWLTVKEGRKEGRKDVIICVTLCIFITYTYAHSFDYSLVLSNFKKGTVLDWWEKRWPYNGSRVPVFRLTLH